MTRNEFEELWANSQKILLRRCKYCTQTHQYVYYKRYDENGLPDNVDILYDVKEHWYQYENNTAYEDFDLFSTYDDAVQNKYAWESVNSNYHKLVLQEILVQTVMFPIYGMCGILLYSTNIMDKD